MSDYDETVIHLLALSQGRALRLCLKMAETTLAILSNDCDRCAVVLIYHACLPKDIDNPQDERLGEMLLSPLFNLACPMVPICLAK